jgi:hypothetical protein
MRLHPFWRCPVCRKLRLASVCLFCGITKEDATSPDLLTRLHEKAAEAVLDAAEPKEVH